MHICEKNNQRDMNKRILSKKRRHVRMYIDFAHSNLYLRSQSARSAQYMVCYDVLARIMVKMDTNSIFGSLKQGADIYIWYVLCYRYQMLTKDIPINHLTGSERASRCRSPACHRRNFVLFCEVFTLDDRDWSCCSSQTFLIFFFPSASYYLVHLA